MYMACKKQMNSMLRTKSPSAKPPLAYMQTPEFKKQETKFAFDLRHVGKGGLACAAITAEEEVVKITPLTVPFLTHLSTVFLFVFNSSFSPGNYPLGQNHYLSTPKNSIMVTVC